MSIDPQLLQISSYQGEGYLPLIDYQAWRVAILRYIDELLPERLDHLQCHTETDEVFVLLEGRCILFLGGNGTAGSTEIHAQDMEPLKLYNVKRGCYHTHTLSEDATVLIVENQDTCDANSPKINLTPEQRAQIIQKTRDLWRTA